MVKRRQVLLLIISTLVLNDDAMALYFTGATLGKNERAVAVSVFGMIPNPSGFHVGIRGIRGITDWFDIEAGGGYARSTWDVPSNFDGTGGFAYRRATTGPVFILAGRFQFYAGERFAFGLRLGGQHSILSALGIGDVGFFDGTDVGAGIFQITGSAKISERVTFYAGTGETQAGLLKVSLLDGNALSAVIPIGIRWMMSDGVMCYVESAVPFGPLTKYKPVGPNGSMAIELRL